MDPILLQKQVRDNSEDLRTYLKELDTWNNEMKRKESELNNEGSGDTAVPTVRNKVKKVDQVEKNSKQGDKKEPVKRIRSFDYKAWDKFDVEKELEKLDTAINTEDAEGSDNDEFDPSEEYQTRLRDEATYEKERGNQFVKQKKWNEAISCYTHAISCYSKDPIYYANRALCFLKKNDLHGAEADCTSALQLDPSYVKALQRRAAAYVGLKQLEEALEDLQQVLDLEPKNVESKKEFKRIEKLLGRHEKQIHAESKHINQIDTSPSESKKKILHSEKDKNNLLKEIGETSTINQKDIPTRNLLKETDKPTIEKDKIQKKPHHDIKIPWPVRENAKSITPIKKLPHQRSKKPLRRVEAMFENESVKNISEKDVCKPNTSSVQNMNTKKEQSNTKIDVKEINSEKAEVVKQYNLPVPKTSVQFYGHWKTIHKNNEQKYMYLKKVNPSEIPNIFQESLESELFSDIILILCENFITNNLPVYHYLLSFSMVKRFSALTMFMSKSDKENLKKLFEYCAKDITVSGSEINSLKVKYEL